MTARRRTPHGPEHGDVTLAVAKTDHTHVGRQLRLKPLALVVLLLQLLAEFLDFQVCFLLRNERHGAVSHTGQRGERPTACTEIC